MWTLFRKEVKGLNTMFNGHFIDVRTFYAWQFNRLPCVHFIGELDVTKAFAFINERFQYQVMDTYQHAWFDHAQQQMLFNEAIFVLNDDRMIELGPDYCHVLFTPKQYAWATVVIKELAAFRKEAINQARVVGFAREPVINNN